MNILTPAVIGQQNRTGLKTTNADVKKIDRG
jgi:hypothetical protein